MPQAGSSTRVELSLLVESAHSPERITLLARLQQVLNAGLHIFPLFAQGFDDGGDHQSLHVGAGRIVGAEL